MALVRAVRRQQSSQPDLCAAFCSLFIASRGISTSAVRHSAGSSNQSTPNPNKTAPAETNAQKPANHNSFIGTDHRRVPEALKQTPEQRVAEANKRAREKMQALRQKQMSGVGSGGLADNSIFADESLSEAVKRDEDRQSAEEGGEIPLSKRNPAHLQLRLNPNPDVRARWQRRMIIRSIRRSGRLTKEMKIARTEREHLSKSAFHLTSVKKLAPLARQITGKPIDEAILQMRFSMKKAAIEVRKHLVQAKNEAIVMRGMGINQEQIDSLRNDESSPVLEDSGISPPLPHQNPTKTIKAGIATPETEIYIAQAWVNRGPYEKAPSPRAKGRMDVLRRPHTGITVLLKEEKTRTREKEQKDAKMLRRRMGKNMWTQLPDRPIVRQSQYVLW